MIVNKRYSEAASPAQRGDGIKISPSTINNWVKRGLECLDILYDQLVNDIKNRGYLQGDETTIKVLTSEKKGATHQGYFWVYQDPVERLVLFDYQPSRGYVATEDILGDFKGYLQSDGYSVYAKIAKKTGVTHLGCPDARDSSIGHTCVVSSKKLWAMTKQGQKRL